MSSAEPALRLPALSFLPRSVRQANSAARSIIVGWLTATLPSLILAALVARLLPQVQGPQFDLPPVLALVSIVLLSPLLETLIMAAALTLLLRFLPATIAIAVSAVGWAIAHSLQAPAWGLVIWWPFLVFSTLFVVWRQRSLAAAIAVPAFVHALNNLGPALLIAAGLST